MAIMTPNLGGIPPVRTGKSGFPGAHPGTAPDPGDIGLACQAGAPGKGKVRPFVIASRFQLAASGAQAIDTDLGDFLAAASVDFITTNNQFPYVVETSEIYCTISAGDVAADAMVETLAILSCLYVIERVNGDPIAYWPIQKLGLILNQGGIKTTGGYGSSVLVPASGAPWKRRYDIRGTYELVLRTTRAFTPTSNIDCAVVMPARQFIGYQARDFGG